MYSDTLGGSLPSAIACLTARLCSDIADDLSYKKKENYTLRHFKERINTYSKERFKYTIHEVKF